MSRLSEMIKELCPDGVEYKKLKEIFDTKNGYTPSKSNESYWENGTIPWFRMEDIRENGHILSDSIQHVNLNAIKGALFPANSIIVATSATVGEHALITVPSLANQRFTYLMLKHEYANAFDIKFLFYYCYKLDLWCLSHLNQGSFPSVDMKQFSRFEIPVPPLAIQNEIVKLLDNFTELTAELTAELALRKKQYEWYCGSLIGGATFPKRKISDIATFRYGYTTSAATSGDARYIRITDITDDGKLNPLDAKYTCISTENKEYLLKRDDLVMARTGATYGKTLYYNMDTPAIYASFLIKIQVDETQMLPRFYWHFTRTPEYWGQANRLVTKGGQPQFNTGAIGRIVIPIPPLETQAKIVSILDRFDALCHDLTQGLPAEIAARKKQYEYYRDKLLTFPRKGKSGGSAR